MFKSFALSINFLCKCKGHLKKKKQNIKISKIFIHLLLVWFWPPNRTAVLPDGTVLVKSWPRPATLCLTWMGTLASALREMMKGGAFGAGSNVGSSLKYKTASSASWPSYSQGVLKKDKKMLRWKYQAEKEQAGRELGLHLMVSCWTWHMKMLHVCLVCWTPASGRNTPWLDYYDSGLQRSSQPTFCSLKHEKHETGEWWNVSLYWKMRTNTSSGWRHYQNTRWQDDLQPTLNLTIHARHTPPLLYIENTRVLIYLIPHVWTWAHLDPWLHILSA